MTDRDSAFNIIGIHLTGYTYEFFEDISAKYMRLGNMLGISFHEAVSQGTVTILKNTGFRFHRMIRVASLEEKAQFANLERMYDKMLRAIMEPEELSLHQDEHGEFFRIGKKRYPFDGSYREYFEEQSLLIEYTILCVIKKNASQVHNRITAYKNPQKEHFSIEEAAEFTGYKKSYLYKVKGMGLLKAGQPVAGGKLTFHRKDLENFMYRDSNKSPEDYL